MDDAQDNARHDQTRATVVKDINTGKGSLRQRPKPSDLEKSTEASVQKQNVERIDDEITSSLRRVWFALVGNQRKRCNSLQS